MSNQTSIKKHPIGTKIKFIKTLTEGANDEHPGCLFATDGETGIIVSHNASEGYMVKTDSYDAPFGASYGDEFILVEAIKQVPGTLVRQTFESNWCPRCGKKPANMIAITTYLPGIVAHSCPDCGLVQQANYLEDLEEVVDVSESFVFPDVDR